MAGHDETCEGGMIKYDKTINNTHLELSTKQFGLVENE
jgi:hypothetical protein